MPTKKKYITFLFAGLCFLNLLLFALYYLRDYLPAEGFYSLPVAAYYIMYYLAAAVEFCLPPLTAIALFPLANGCIRPSLVSAAVLSIPRALYLIPYYYIYSIGGGNDSIESIITALLIAIAGLALLFCHIILLIFIIRLVTRKAISRLLIADTPYLKRRDRARELECAVEKAFPENLGRRDFFDLSVPITLGVFAVAVIEFAAPLITEIVNTVQFFITYSSYTAEEIFAICFSFIFLLAELMLVQILGMIVKDLSLKVSEAQIDG